MTAMLTDVGLVLTSVLDFAGEVATFIVTTPIAMIGVAFMVIGFAIGIIKGLK